MAYGYRDRLRNGNNSNILRDNISFDLSETANVFIEPIKSRRPFSRAPGYFYSTCSLSFLIVKSNAIFTSFSTVTFNRFAVPATRLRETTRGSVSNYSTR